jgi:hypothetical protein
MTTITIPQSESMPLVFDPHPDRPLADIEIVIPVYNEEGDLARSVQRLSSYLDAHFPLSWLITVADNASTDSTWTIACALAATSDRVRAVHLDQKGRGRALRTVWSASTSPVVAYMDVDLSTDLAAFLPLVAPLISGHSDLAIGSRLARGARVARGPKREAISRSYNLLLKATLQAGFSDAQCGFKAARTEAVQPLLHLVQDQGWFFDTELLVLAEHNGLRIHEVPVDWIDDTDSRVHIASTVATDLRGVWRMLRTFARGDGSVELPAAGVDVGERPLAERLVRFASVGTVSTVLMAALIAVITATLGIVLAGIVMLCALVVASGLAVVGTFGPHRYVSRGTRSE